MFKFFDTIIGKIAVGLMSIAIHLGAAIPTQTPSPVPVGNTQQTIQSTTPAPTIKQQPTKTVIQTRQLQKDDQKIVTPTPQPSKQQPYVLPPTADQIAELTLFCLSDSTVQAICANPNFMPGYYSNAAFRTSIDDLIKKYQAALSAQQQQKFAAQKKQADCLLAPTPEELRTLSPEQQKHIRDIECGTATSQSELNYKLYQQQQYGDCIANKKYSWGYCDSLKPIFY